MAKPIISKFSVIDATRENIVRYTCYDDTINEVEYIIYDNASGNIIVDQTVKTSGSSSVRMFMLPANLVHNRLLPYYLKIAVTNQNGKKSDLSDAVLFYCHEKPVLKFVDVEARAEKTIPFPAFSFNVEYKNIEEEGETLNLYKYQLYDSDKTLLHEEIYHGSISHAFNVEGLDNNKILELDSFGVDCTIYGKTIRVKNMIAAVEGGIAAGRILSAADVAAIAGCTKDELDKYFHDTSVFVGYSMHDIQGTIWELKDGLTQIYNFYHALYSGEAEIRTGTNFVDTDGVHWYGAGVYAIQQNGYSYDATTNKLSLSCLDMTCLLDGTLGGTLTGYATRIPMYDRKLVVKDGVNYYEDDKKKPHYVRDSIKETFELSGLTKSMVDYWVRRIPHDLEYNTGTTIWNILTELRDLYFPFEMYFDDDTFVCKEIPSGYDDPVVLDEDTFKSMVISEDASVDYSQIHNCVEVWGASNSSDYFCKDKLEKNDPEGTGEVVYCRKGTSEWNDIVTLLRDNKLNMSYNMNPNDTGASILLLKLKQASIQDGTRFSFICPEDIAINARICVENLVTTIKSNPSGEGQYRETTCAVYGPMMLFKAVTNEKGEDEPEDTSLLKKGRYYVIKYGEHWLNQATDGAFTYKFNALTGKYEKEQRDPQVRYYPKQIYNPSTKNYDTVYVKYNPATNTEIQISDPALLIESRVYFIGQSQSHAMTKFVDAMPTAKQIEADKIAEACDNLEYVVVNDPNRIDDLYNSRLTIDKIGRRNLVCSGSEFDGYTSDESAMTVCKYTLWKNCRLTDSITLSMHMIPWLDVNEKVKYAAKYLKSDIAVEWIIKKIDKNIGEGTMNVTLSRYYHWRKVCKPKQ